MGSYFGAPSEATVGVFVVPKKLWKQRLIFDTRLRRPWHCVSPTPASWAGLQLPADSAYHMAQTDVNTAFYLILAPTGTSEYFILPRSSRSFVSPQLRVLAMGFFLGALLCQKMVESCVRASGFPHGSSPGTCDDPGCDLFRG